MAKAGMTAARSQRIKDAIERALRAGFAPYREAGGRGSSLSEAVRALREAGHAENRNSVGGFIRTQEGRKARGDDHFLPDWSLYAPAGVAAGDLRSGEVRRWIVTSAQDDTDVHPRFWSNLRAYATSLGAELLVGGFTYQTIRHSDRLTLTGTFREEVRPFLRFDPMDLGPVLFCAEMNTLPTAARPLSGLLSYSRGRDAIFPHAKLAYQTAPAPRGEHVPSLMTTGACTVPNYVDKKAGKKANWTAGCIAVKDREIEEIYAMVRTGTVITIRA